MILITAFERFGLSKNNIGKDVAMLIKKELVGDDEESLAKMKDYNNNDSLEDKEIKFIVLPVDEEGIESFKSYLKFEKPEMIIHLGHLSMSSDFRIESSAYSSKKEKLSSDLARYIALKSGIKLTNKIGNYYCNKIYFASLSNKYNSLFIHIGSKYEPTKAMLNIFKIIKYCKEVEDKNKNG